MGKEDAVKRKRFTVEQIVAVFKQTEMGTPVSDLIRHLGIAEQTFYRWKQRYEGLESDQVREFKQLQDENTKLKRLVADLLLDKVMLQDAWCRRQERGEHISGGAGSFKDPPDEVSRVSEALYTETEEGHSAPIRHDRIERSLRQPPPHRLRGAAATRAPVRPRLAVRLVPSGLA